MVNFGLRQLHHFVEIAEAGSFREAAERTFTAQPALTVSIQKLEAALGVQLFERGSRGVRLTAAGETFLVDARRTLLHAEQGRQNARLVALGELGLVRLGFVGTAVYSVLPRHLPTFIARNPSIRLELHESTTVSIIEMLREGRIDLGIFRPGEFDVRGLRLTEVEKDDLVAVVPKSHRLSGHKEITLSEVAEDAFVMFSEAQVPGLRSAIFRACRTAGFVPRVTTEATQAVTVVGLVGSGLGVALVPGVVARFTNKEVRFVRVRDPVCAGCLTLAVGTSEVGASTAADRLRETIAASALRQAGRAGQEARATGR